MTDITLPDLVVPGPIYPWQRYTGSEDAISAIEKYAEGKGRTWKPLPSALDLPDRGPQTALARQVLRAQNEFLLRLVTDSPERAPTEAIAHLLRRHQHGPITGAFNQVYARLVRVDMYSRRFDQQDNNVLDVRDFGVGLPQHRVLDICDSMHSSWALEDYLQGRPSYGYAPYTLIATRQEGTPVTVAIIRRMHGPRYFLLVDHGDLLTLPGLEDQFPTGTLVRHLNFEAPLYNAFKENSVQGVLDRTLPEMAFPVATFYHDLISGSAHSRLALGSERRLREWIGQGKAKVSTHRAIVEDTHIQVHQYGFHGSLDERRHHCHPKGSVLFVFRGQTIATANGLSSVMLVDVSGFTHDQLERLRSDSEWRGDLAKRLLSEACTEPSPYSAEMAVPAE